MIALCDGAFFLPWYGRFFDPIRFRNRRNNKTRIDHLTGTGLLLDSGLYLRQILVLFKHGAFVPDIPIVTAISAERLGLHADELCVHDLGKVVVGFTEVRQKRFIIFSLPI